MSRFLQLISHYTVIVMPDADVDTYVKEIST